MKGQCLLVSGGAFCKIPAELRKAETVIACDRGWQYAEKLGVEPNLIVGDFDSFSGDLPKDIPVLKLPCEKDETDTMAAVSYAVENGFNEILILCALGARLDHLLGNLQTAAYAAKRGLDVKISDKDNEICVCSKNELVFPKRTGFSISLVSLTDKCENVSVSGAKYKLKNAVLNNFSTLGISNEWEGDITVRVGNGVLAVVMARLK